MIFREKLVCAIRFMIDAESKAIKLYHKNAESAGCETATRAQAHSRMS